MAYSPTTWVDGVTPVNATNLNKLETGVDVAHDDVAALNTRLLAEEAQPDIPAVVNGKWIKGVGGALVWSDIVAADVGGLTALLDAKVDDTEKGAVSGVATLDSAQRLVQKHTVDKLYAQGITEGHHPVARSGVAVWEAVAAGGADLSYDGDWVAGTYQDGDVVVKDGIAYLCVGGPTTAAPSISPWGQAGLSIVGDELGYAERTTDLAVTGGSPAAGQVMVTAPAITLDGATPIIVEFYAPGMNRTSAGEIWFALFDGASEIGEAGADVVSTANWDTGPVVMRRRLTPTAGSHTYSVRAYSPAGAGGTVVAGPGSGSDYQPAFIRVTRVAPSPPQFGAGALTPVTYGTTLPASPADGQEAILVDSVTAPTYSWRFRYNASASGPYKWEFVGGAPRLDVATDSQNPAVGWELLYASVPRPGVYDVSGAVEFRHATTAGIFGQVVAAIDAGAAGVVPQDYALTTAAVWYTSGVCREKLTLAAAASITIRLISMSAGGIAMRNRWISISPVRVA